MKKIFKIIALSSVAIILLSGCEVKKEHINQTNPTRKESSASQALNGKTITKDEGQNLSSADTSKSSSLSQGVSETTTTYPYSVKLDSPLSFHFEGVNLPESVEINGTNISSVNFIGFHRKGS
ncbi:hypothetical protein [Lactococcus taiwanensis]|uniref:hypothetical protein n=1 Tax=Lactococcus taiwanensis TaxID=1151742 RepID=UPI0028A07C56|nr:hypothetical protein [Lactococcus taiwanensis]